MTYQARLTVVAACVRVATRTAALDAPGVFLGGAIFGARVVGAYRLAALVFVTLVILANDLVRTVDQGVPVRALDGVAALHG